MITDMISNKKFNQILTGLYIRGKKLNISNVFITQYCFTVPKDLSINYTLLLL